MKMWPQGLSKGKNYGNGVFGAVRGGRSILRAVWRVLYKRRKGKQRDERDGVGTACGFLSGVARDNRLVLGKYEKAV